MLLKRIEGLCVIMHPANINATALEHVSPSPVIDAQQCQHYLCQDFSGGRVLLKHMHNIT